MIHLRELRQREQVFIQPVSVRLRRRDLPFDFLVRNDAPLLHVHDEHAARLQTSFDRDILRRKRKHARLARHHHDVVFRHVVTRRPQTIAVQRRADHFAIGESDRRRAIPRLHEARVIFVKRLQLIAHRLVTAPRLRNHHHHRMRQRTPREHEKLQHIVEHRRVRAVRIHHRQRLLEILAEKRRIRQRLTRVHPVDIPAQRVDFTIVGDVAIRMRTVPARERIRRKPRVNQRQPRLHIRVAQIREILAHLVRQQHAFIDQRLVRQTAHIPEIPTRQRRAPDLVKRPLADHIKLPLKSRIVRAILTALDKGHHHRRLRALRSLAERRIIRRHLPPAQEILPFRRHDLLENLLQLPTQRRVLRHEEKPRPVLPLRRELDLPLRHLAQKRIRHLHQNARTVARIHLRATSAAVVEIDEHLQALRHDFMRLLPLHVSDKADAASVMLKPWIVKPLLLRIPDRNCRGRVASWLVVLHRRKVFPPSHSFLRMKSDAENAKTDTNCPLFLLGMHILRHPIGTKGRMFGF